MKNKIVQDYSFYEHYHIVHIASQLSNYKIAWALNKHAKTAFRKLPELTVCNPKTGIPLNCGLFNWISPNSIEYFLITSLEQQSTLSQETFLLIEGREQKDTVMRFIEKATSFDFIFSIEEIHINTPTTTPKRRQLIEHLNNISIDLESHITKIKEKLKYKPKKKKE